VEIDEASEAEKQDAVTKILGVYEVHIIYLWCVSGAPAWDRQHRQVLVVLPPYSSLLPLFLCSLLSFSIAANMMSRLSFFYLCLLALTAIIAPHVSAQSATSEGATPAPGVTTTSSAPITPPTSILASGTGSSGSGASSSSRESGSSSALSGPADVVLKVPNLSVGRIELDVEQLAADINLNAKVAGLVTVCHCLYR
jgi:hypothetical protein